MPKMPKNLSKPSACTCDECDKKSTVLWKARYGYWFCPLCWESIEPVSPTRQKLIDRFKESLRAGQ